MRPSSLQRMPVLSAISTAARALHVMKAEVYPASCHPNLMLGRKAGALVQAAAGGPRALASRPNSCRSSRRPSAVLSSRCEAVRKTTRWYGRRGPSAKRAKLASVRCTTPSRAARCSASRSPSSAVSCAQPPGCLHFFWVGCGSSSAVRFHLRPPLVVVLDCAARHALPGPVLYASPFGAQARWAAGPAAGAGHAPLATTAPSAKLKAGTCQRLP